MTKDLRPAGTRGLLPASELGAFEELPGGGCDLSTRALDDHSRTKHVLVNAS